MKKMCKRLNGDVSNKLMKKMLNVTRYQGYLKPIKMLAESLLKP